MCSRAAGQALVSFDTDGGTHGERGAAKVGRASLLVSHPLRKVGKCGKGIPLLGGFPLSGVSRFNIMAKCSIHHEQAAGITGGE